MQKATLKLLSDTLIRAGLPYEFNEFSSSIEDLERYWVGEYTEVTPMTEDGLEEATFMLTGTSKKGRLALENDKQTIKSIFHTISGYTAILENKTGVAIFYEDAMYIPTGEGFTCRMQINLRIKEWMVN